MIDTLPIILQAALLGLLVAAPVGPVAVLCVQRTLRYGLFSGIQFGLGVAMADALFSVIAAFGLTAVMMLMIQSSVWISLVGGVYLFYLGYNAFKHRHLIDNLSSNKKMKAHHNVLMAFLITLTNPMTILSFVALFAGVVSEKYTHNLIRNGMEFVVGIFLGSLTWWIVLSLVSTFLRRNSKTTWLNGINTACGVLLMAFGTFLVVKSTLNILA